MMLIPEGRDINERKHAEDALFNEKEKLRFLSENAPFGMALIDSNGPFPLYKSRIQGNIRI